MVLYDHIYDVDDFFGEPYPELIEFFTAYPSRGHILDLGCGQGRDAIALAKMGYKVSGIDVSELGVKQMLNKAKEEGLNINGRVCDMFRFEITGFYDIIILNSILHFEKDDKKKEVELLLRISEKIKNKGLICICIWKSEQKEKIIREIFSRSSFNWKILNDSYLKYTFKDRKTGHTVDMIYHMLIVQKNYDK
jgi:2-polyprenyl-3-methyl-5-hydroxy-6-metoxy-1,4-benzoquinol methylase